MSLQCNVYSDSLHLPDTPPDTLKMGGDSLSTYLHSQTHTTEPHYTTTNIQIAMGHLVETISTYSSRVDFTLISYYICIALNTATDTIDPRIPTTTQH